VATLDFPATSTLHQFDRAALDSTLTQILRYARKGLLQLADHARFWDEERGVLATFADKIVTETGLLLLLTNRVPDRSVVLRQAESALVHSLIPLARSDRLKLLIMRYPQMVSSVGFAHTALAAAGHPDEAFGEAVASAFQSGLVCATERLPFRLMDVRWQESLRSLHRQDSPQYQFEGSILVADPPRHHAHLFWKTHTP
jgi:hypothetical protein